MSPCGAFIGWRSSRNVGTIMQKSALLFLKICRYELRQNCLSSISKNSNRHFNLLLANHAISLFEKSSSQNPQNPMGIRYGDSHRPFAFSCCWRRSHLHRRYSRIPQVCQEPNRSPLLSGKDCIGRRDKAPTSAPA